MISKKIQRLLALGLVILFSFSLTTMAFAEEAEITSWDDQTGATIVTEEEMQQLKAIGESVGLSRIYAQSLSMPKYYQDDSRWGSVLINKQTMQAVGCAVTSFTMIANHFKNVGDPGVVAAKLDSLGYANPFAYASAASTYGLTAHVYDNTQVANMSYSSIKTQIVANIEVGRPVMVGLKKGTSTHFVAAYGYTDNGNAVRIYDPWSPRDYSRLDQYIDAGWSVHRLSYYTE